jgi:murein DD-endopeptidase MepM/ murein hydrolase activator NlpD
MSKALGFVIFIFIVLVVGNAFITAASSLLLPGQLSHAAGLPNLGIGSSFGFGASGFSGLSIHANLFSKDGSGMSYVTQGYGHTPYSAVYPGGWHDGVDLAAVYGATIYSPSNGIVIATGNQDNYCYHRGFGKYVAVHDSANNLVLWYAHLGTINVVPGDVVAKGAELGTVGLTGFETGTHLHFSIFQANGFTMTPRDGCGPEPTGQDLDPLNYLGSVYN